VTAESKYNISRGLMNCRLFNYAVSTEWLLNVNQYEVSLSSINMKNWNHTHCKVPQLRLQVSTVPLRMKCSEMLLSYSIL
jgi:hypothetical protein